jgi:AcrR family transcriptional regulator
MGSASPYRPFAKCDRDAPPQRLLAHQRRHTPGCFLALEPRLAEHRETLRRRIAERVTQGIEEGEVPEGSDPEQIASYIMAVHNGMAARARDGGTTTELLAIADTGLSALPAR